MDISTFLTGARDTLTTSRVFGEPYEKNGVTIIPAASIRGGGGGGGSDAGDGGDGPPSGSGGGFGLRATPVGAYVVRDGEVTWQPAVDVNRVIAGGQLLGLVALLVLRGMSKRRHARALAIAKDA